MGQLFGPLAAEFPVAGNGAPRPGGFTLFPDLGDFSRSVLDERVDANDRRDAGTLYDSNMMQQIGASLLDPLDVYLRVFLRQRLARNRHGRAAVAFQDADRGHDDGRIGLEPAVMTLQGPEFLDTDVGG